jgi:hypothetical protein
VAIIKALQKRFLHHFASVNAFLVCKWTPCDVKQMLNPCRVARWDGRNMRHISLLALYAALMETEVDTYPAMT